MSTSIKLEECSLYLKVKTPIVFICFCRGIEKCPLLRGVPILIEVSLYIKRIRYDTVGPRVHFHDVVKRSLIRSRVLETNKKKHGNHNVSRAFLLRTM